MSQYQDQTKKKPLILSHKMKYNQPTLLIKDKIKKDKSTEKQNIYDPQTKKFKDFTNNKYTTHYQTENNIKNHYQTQSNLKMYEKNNTNAQVIPLTPSNIDLNGNIKVNKNLTFGIVKNNQKNYSTSGNDQNEIPQSNPIISVNVNIQNVQQNVYDYKKNTTSKFQMKPITLKRNLQNQQHIQPQVPIHNERRFKINLNNEKTLKIDEDKKKMNNTMMNATERYTERNSILDRTTVDRNAEINQKKKEKFKKQFQGKFIMNTSPTVDKEFLCDEELDIKPIEKKPSLYEKKLSEKKLSVPQITQNIPQTQNFMMPNPSNALINGQKYVKKMDRKPVEKELKEFESKQQNLNEIWQSEAIYVLFGQQQKYMVDPTYLQKNQKSIAWSTRAILVDWMRQLSHQYTLKRDTYHLAVVLLDNYLAKKPNIQKQVAQIIGATTLFIASKLEELECKPSECFAESTQGICTAKDIQNWQIQICKTLRFNLNPPTLYSLANRIMNQWDKYIEQVDYAMHHPCFQENGKVYFKRMDQPSYKMFRQLMQFVDCVILDVQTAQYKPLLIILSVLYLIVGTKVARFQFDEIHQVFPRSSHYLLDRSNYFNDLFENFVGMSFGMTLLQILPSVQYIASYFNLSLTYEKPILGDQQQLDFMVLQEYCSYQTYNKYMLKTVTTRFRGIMNAF